MSEFNPTQPEDLADRRIFELSPEKFDEFVALLDKPAEPCPKLEELFARPTAIDTEAATPAPRLAVILGYPRRIRR